MLPEFDPSRLFHENGLVRKEPAGIIFIFTPCILKIH